MKITVTGSIGHIGKPLVEQLVAAGHTVKVISSSPERSSDIEQLGAEPIVGSVEDVALLTKAFAGADAVYTMVPPTFETLDWKKHIAGIGGKYAQAIQAAGVRYVVNLSSFGAHLPEGCGPVSGLYFVEQSLNSLENVSVKHLRPGYFYYNFYSQISLIKNAGIMGSNFGPDVKLPLADVTEIAKVAFEELNSLSFEGNSHRYIASDIRTPQEIASAIGVQINQPDLKWVQFSNEDFVNALTSDGLGKEIAENFAEMGASIENGSMIGDFASDTPTEKKRVEEFAKEFAKNFSATVTH
jgi:uncharacterized protein YbjT (DUF2867 family)